MIPVLSLQQRVCSLLLKPFPSKDAVEHILGLSVTSVIFITLNPYKSYKNVLELWMAAFIWKGNWVHFHTSGWWCLQSTASRWRPTHRKSVYSFFYTVLGLYLQMAGTSKWISPLTSFVPFPLAFLSLSDWKKCKMSLYTLFSASDIGIILHVCKIQSFVFM